MEVTIHPNDFSNLIRCLSLLKDKCNDVRICEGILRQRTNDKANVFEMDLTPLVSDCDIVLSNVKSKISMLKGLSGQKVKITSTDNNISFLGEPSMFKFDNPRLNFLDNKFMSSEELGKIFPLKEEDVVLEYYIGKETSRIMKVISSQFHIVSFNVCFEGDTASIIATATSKDHYARIEHGIPIKGPLKCFSNLVVTPFLLDHDGDTLLKMYNVQETVCINKFKTLVGKATVTVYGRSQLIEEEESDNSETTQRPECAGSFDHSN
jgi:hypothetical protein